MQNTLSIIIPIYNEKKLISKFIDRLYKSFKSINCQFIFVDDGSTDGTTEWLDENLKLFFKNENYKLIKIDKNYGKANAVKKAIDFVEGKFTLLIDSDLEYDPVDARELYEIAIENESIEVIQGSRYLGGKIQLRKHLLNDIAVRVNTLLFNFLFDQSITDLHTGTKIIKSNFLKKLNLSFSRFGLEIDVNSQIAKHDINIYEYGIGYIERSKSEGKKITYIDGIFFYYFIFMARFIQNDLTTNISILYSFIFMTYAGTYFGLGLGKIMITILFAITGMIIGLKRKIIPLTLVFGAIYVGSLFSKGNGRIFPIVLFFIIALIYSKKLSGKLKFIKKNALTKFFI